MADPTRRLVDEPLISIDAEQLVRIEAVHRGFLYQHLCAVGAILLAPDAGVREIVVEGEEDVQLVADELDVYVQVKTRNRPITPGDLRATLERFDQIRASHGGQRGLRFIILSNARPGPQLEGEGLSGQPMSCFASLGSTLMSSRAFPPHGRA